MKNGRGGGRNSVRGVINRMWILLGRFWMGIDNEYDGESEYRMVKGK